jgi:RNA-directed DNA polymerase
MKYVIGHYTGTTGGHHPGHEIYDMKAETDLFSDSIAVAFLMKFINPKKRITAIDDNLFRQFLDCTNYQSIELITIVTNRNLNNELWGHLEQLVRKINKGEIREQLYA